MPREASYQATQIFSIVMGKLFKYQLHHFLADSDQCARPLKSSMATFKIIQHTQWSKMREFDINGRDTILFNSNQLLAFADDIDIMGSTTRDEQTAFMQIAKVVGAKFRAAY